MPTLPWGYLHLACYIGISVCVYTNYALYMPVYTAQSGVGGMCWDDSDEACVIVYMSCMYNMYVCTYVVKLLVYMACGQCGCVCMCVCG